MADLKQKKLDFQQSLEQYLEEEKIHDIFQDMMQSLIKDRPKDPIDYLINKF